MLPEKGIKCHRTFARPDGPIDCRTLVCDHGCKLWKRVTLVDRHPETGAEIPADAYDCLDSQQELFWKDMLRRQLQTTATVDHLRKEVHDANDQQMVGAISRLNRQMDEARAIAAPQQKLLEQ
jgi:hypothetical protein